MIDRFKVTIKLFLKVTLGLTKTNKLNLVQKSLYLDYFGMDIFCYLVRNTFTRYRFFNVFGFDSSFYLLFTGLYLYWPACRSLVGIASGLSCLINPLSFPFVSLSLSVKEAVWLCGKLHLFYFCIIYDIYSEQSVFLCSILFFIAYFNFS